jgi:hypothetical protein
VLDGIGVPGVELVVEFVLATGVRVMSAGLMPSILQFVITPLSVSQVQS